MANGSNGSGKGDAGGNDNGQAQGSVGRLPILLVPGFMSTALSCERSKSNPSWQGARVWLALDKLGLSSVYRWGWGDSVSQARTNQDRAHCADAPDDDDSWPSLDGEGCRNTALVSEWVKHVQLKTPTEESDGVHLKPVGGLAGINFLTDGALTKAMTSVFSEVTKFLQEKGYKEGVDLDAVPYDWRFAPSVLQKRDGYFDTVKESIEKLNRRGTGVILLGHSMGNKIIHYFLKHAEATWGREWIDLNVHTWLAAGAPNLGAPQATKCTMLGDKMGLDAFLTKQEGLVLAQSFSSSPWLMPTGPMSAKTCYLRRQGVLEIKGLQARIPGRWMSPRNEVSVTLEVNWGLHSGNLCVPLVSTPAEDWNGKIGMFPPERNLFRFAGPTELRNDATVIAIVKEAGAPRRICSCLFCCARLGDAVRVANEAAHGRGGKGAPRAWSETANLATLLRKGKPDQDGFVDVDLEVGRDGCLWCWCQCYSYIRFKMRWMTCEDVHKKLLKWQPPNEPEDTVPVAHSRQPKTIKYDKFSVNDVLVADDSHNGPGRVWERLYREDPLFDDTGSADPPPVRRVVAVHGVNVPTEAFYALAIKSKRVDTNTKKPLFELDAESDLKPEYRIKGASGIGRFQMNGGIATDMPTSSNITGDGTVPLWSLDHVRVWKDSVESVNVEYLDNANHRDMLSDERFHAAIWKVASGTN